MTGMLAIAMTKQPQTIRCLRLPGSVRGFATLAFLTLCAVWLYTGQFEETNAYIGIVSLEAVHDVSYWMIMLAWLFVLALLLPVQVRSPSDIFLCLYLLGTCLWSASYWPATHLIDELQAMLLGAMLLLPAVLVCGGRGLAGILSRAPKRSGGYLPACWLVPISVGLLLLAMALGYRAAGADGGFDFEEAFLRRLSGRDSFAGDALAAYLMQMSMNGLSPFLAFLGAYRRSRVGLLLAFGFAVFSFWLLASKAPFVNVAVLALLGHLVRKGQVTRFTNWIVRGLVALMLLAVIELWTFDFSVIAEFGIRRVILVSSTIQAYFLHAMAQQGWSLMLLNGLNTAGYGSPEFYVGANYMGNELTNANTNAYLHQAALGGALGYLLVVGLTALFMLVLDMMYLRGRRVEGFALSAMTGILLIEQALMTTMVSSGVALCLLLALVFSRESRPPVTDGWLTYPRIAP